MLSFPLLLAGAALFTAQAQTPTAETPAPRPNIIFILCDDLGYGDVGVFYQNQRAELKDRGVPFFSTPYIDTLARDGVKLVQHYSGAPVCAPSRASLLLGLTQGHANVRDNQFDKALADSHTLGTVLQRAGYSTAAFGKWGLQGVGKPADNGKKPGAGDPPEISAGVSGDAWPAYPTKRGFDYFYGYVRHGDGHFHYPKEDKREVWENDREVSADLDKCYTTDLFTARAKKWIIEQTAAHPKKPFFIYLAFDTPHAKLQNPPCAYPAGGGLKGGVQWIGKPHQMLNTAAGECDGYMFPDYAKETWDHDRNPTTPEVPWPDVQKRYANDVRRIDFAVGDLLQLLKDLKIDDNTLVVFTSDNGPSAESALPEKYAPTFFRGFGSFDGIKRDLWEGGMREPTLARLPGRIPAGRVDKEPSGQWNWLATFCDLAGVPVPAASDGVSLLPSLTGQGKQMPGTLYMEYFENHSTPKYKEFDPSHAGRKRMQMQAVYLNGFKGVRYDVKSENDDFEIYNLAKDEQEARNLASAPEFAKLQQEMKAAVLRDRMPNPSSPRPYDAAPVPALSSVEALMPGVNWQAFAGTWPWLPQFETMTPVASGNARQPELNAVPITKDNGVLFTGYLSVPATGQYTFYITSDGPHFLRIHNCQVVDGDLGHVSGSTAKGQILLAEGRHPFRLYYARPPGTATAPQLKFEWSGPGIDRQIVPATVLSHD